MLYITYMWNLKKSKKYNKLVNISKKQQTHRYREQNRLLVGRGKWGRSDIGVVD